MSLFAYCKPFLRPYYYHLKHRIWQWQNKEPEYQLQQKQLMLQLALMQNNGIKPYKKISHAGFRCYSQYEEDGIILYVLSMIGMKSRKLVEISCGVGSECMAANLIINHGFEATLFEGDPVNAKIAQSFFESKKDCIMNQPTITQAWVTAENVNELLVKSGAEGEIDFLSLDIDGNDYWVWKAMEVVQPRLCVFEINNVIPENKSLTVHYEPDFNSTARPALEKDYKGVSLAAMVKLGKEKGYRMIGAHRHGFNVFFLRNDVGQDDFPEVSLEEVQENTWTRWSQTHRWPVVSHLNWCEV